MISSIVNDPNIVEKVKAIPIFEKIKEKEDLLMMLLDIMVKKNFDKDEIIICEGDLGNEMFILLSGSVSVKKKTRAGDDYTVAYLKDSDNIFFGEHALIDNDKRSATVTAIEPSELLVICKENFLKLCEEHNEIGWHVILPMAKMIAVNLRKTNNDMLTIFDALVSEIDD